MSTKREQLLSQIVECLHGAWADQLQYQLSHIAPKNTAEWKRQASAPVSELDPGVVIERYAGTANFILGQFDGTVPGWDLEAPAATPKTPRKKTDPGQSPAPAPAQASAPQAAPETSSPATSPRRRPPRK